MKALAIILNVLFPGVGTLVIKRFGLGILQIVLSLVGVILTVTVIGAIVGVPLMIGVWIWAIIVAVKAPDPAGAQVPEDSKTA